MRTDRTFRDPVCGMDVYPATAAARTVHAGQTYYFCSTHCKAKFDADPARYVETAKASSEHPLEHDRAHSHHTHHDKSSKAVRPSANTKYFCPMNLESVRELRNSGHSALYGDFRHPGTLVEAGVDTTEKFILSADIKDAADIIKQALELNPDLRVLARCAHLRDAAALRGAGADFVAAGEAEVGVVLTDGVISPGDS